jgi:V/A-type H+-transporting ATPase subunit K
MVLDPNVFNLAGIGAALAIGLAGIGTGISQGQIGASTVGAISYDKSFFGLGVVFVALPETPASASTTFSGTPVKL